MIELQQAAKEFHMYTLELQRPHETEDNQYDDELVCCVNCGEEFDSPEDADTDYCQAWEI